MDFSINLTLFLFGSYILSIAINHAMTKDGFKASRDTIDSIILIFLDYLKNLFTKDSLKIIRKAIDSVIQVSWKYLKDLFSKKEEDSQYVPDAVLIQELMTCLAPYSELPMAYTEWLQSTYSSFSLPAIRIQLICKTEESFPIIRNILINVFNQHLAESGLYGTYSWITIEKYAENCYCLILIYAISDIEKENLKRLIRMRKYQAEMIAKKSVQAVVDDELENELKKSEIDDEES